MTPVITVASDSCCKVSCHRGSVTLYKTMFYVGMAVSVTVAVQTITTKAYPPLYVLIVAGVAGIVGILGAIKLFGHHCLNNSHGDNRASTNTAANTAANI